MFLGGAVNSGLNFGEPLPLATGSGRLCIACVSLDVMEICPPNFRPRFFMSGLGGGGL